MNKDKIVPIILCGGTGSRLWPLSRASHPKQYLKVDNKEKFSFFQNTLKRINSFKIADNPIIICNEEHRFIVAEQLRSLGIKAKAILLEPTGRNTAPAVTIAAIRAIKENANSNLLILPADHLIKNSEEFQRVIISAINYSSKGRIVTFGIIPTKVETGYGYIESLNVLDTKNLVGEKIVNFIEKPEKKLAEKFVLDKKFSWNSGIFMFNASVFIEEIKKWSPNIFKYCHQSLSKSILDLDFERIEEQSFSLCEDISIDKAIMEKTELGMVLPLKAEWSDIGSWESMWDVSEKDSKGNVSQGNIIIENVFNSYLRSEDNRLIVGIGLDDLIIIDTSDAILIIRKDESQKVKKIVHKLLLENKTEALNHKTIYRPWGNYNSIAKGSNWQVKKIIVKPNESLSLQMHNHRSEHWVVVSGTALVEINAEERLLYKNESCYIPVGSKHRVSNPGKEILTLIEVQSGSYFGEDDIIRFKDNYGRI